MACFVGDTNSCMTRQLRGGTCKRACPCQKTNSASETSMNTESVCGVKLFRLEDAQHRIKFAAEGERNWIKLSNSSRGEGEEQTGKKGGGGGSRAVSRDTEIL